MVDRFAQFHARTSSVGELLSGAGGAGEGNGGEGNAGSGRRLLRAWPAPIGGIGGYEIEEQEAAEVLQNLSRRNTVVGGSDRGQGEAGVDG